MSYRKNNSQVKIAPTKVIEPADFYVKILIIIRIEETIISLV